MKLMLCAFFVAAITLGDCGAAGASCSTNTSPDYSDIAQVTLVRCDLVHRNTPCFRATLNLRASNVVGGDLNSIKENPLHGTFVVAPQDAGELITVLQAGDALQMHVAPAPPSIDGQLNIVVLRVCKTVKTLHTQGPIDDFQHAQWNGLLNALQAAIARLRWTRTSNTPNYKEPPAWFSLGADNEPHVR
jgi:hypothetical protein